MRISYGVACAAAILLSACDAKGGRTDYANDGDTGRRRRPPRRP